MHKFNQPPKNWQENAFMKECQMTLRIPSVPKSFVEIALSCTVSEIHVNAFLNTKIQDGCQKWQENLQSISLGPNLTPFLRY